MTKEKLIGRSKMQLMLRICPRNVVTVARHKRCGTLQTMQRAAYDPLRLLFLAILSSNYLPSCLVLGDTSDAGTNGSGTLLANNCSTTLTACGGDVTGTWALQFICAQSTLMDAINAADARYPDCGNVCTAASLTATGSVTYAAPTVSSSLSFQLVESFSFSDACFSEYTGTTLTDSTCQSFTNDPSGASSCALSQSVCACQINQTISDTATTYALAAPDITQYGSGSGGQGESIPYCVTGNSMTQQRTLAGGVSYLLQFAKQ